MVVVLHKQTKLWDQELSLFFFVFGTELANFDLLVDEWRKPKLNRRFRSATAGVVALEVGVDIAADS